MGKKVATFALCVGICVGLANAENLGESMQNSPKSALDSHESIVESTPESNIDCHDSTQCVESRNDDSNDSPESAESLLDSHKSIADLPKSTAQKTFKDPEFPDYDDDVEFLQSLIERFSMHNENYFLPLYYNTNIFQSRDVKPYIKPYNKFEVKLQISAKASIFKNLFGTGLGSYFAYTQKSFFQLYSRDISSPFRSTDYNPEFMIYRPFDFGLNVRFGYRHLSNGDAGLDSRSINIMALDLVYKISDFRATLKSWVYLTHDPSDIRKYLGYSDLILEYDFLERNHLSLTIGNLVHNYKHYKGNVKLEYRVDLRHFGIFVQYFYGYGDSLHEYNLKKHAVGVGLALARFKTKDFQRK